MISTDPEDAASLYLAIGELLHEFRGEGKYWCSLGAALDAEQDKTGQEIR